MARLSAIASERQRLENARERCLHQLTQGVGASDEMLNPIHRTVDEKWRRHLDRRIQEKTFELARLAAKEQEQISRTRRSLGRENAMSTLVERAKSDRTKP